MTRANVARGLEAERRSVGVLVAGVRDVEQMTGVIAQINALDDAPSYPIASVDKRNSEGPRPPFAARELICRVVGLVSEEYG